LTINCLRLFQQSRRFELKPGEPIHGSRVRSAPPLELAEPGSDGNLGFNAAQVLTREV
jgi:hypothetical protein